MKTELKNKMIPQLRFPEFEGEWVEKKFDDFYSFKTTNSFSRDKLNYESGEVKNIHYGDIHTKFDSLFDIEKEYVPFINNNIDISRIPDECYLQEGDLVIADASEDYNDIGKTIEIHNLNGEKVLAGLHTFLARKESDEMVNDFASFLMKTHQVRLEIMKIAQGIKVLGISKNRLDKIPLIAPNPEEQTRIATFLTAVDKRINLLQKKKAELEQYKKGVMQRIFVSNHDYKDYPDVHDFKNQENKNQGNHGNQEKSRFRLRFKDENGNDFPDWEEKRLGEVAKVKRGASPRPISSSIWFDEESEVGWVRISDVSRSNKFLTKTAQYLSKEGISKSRLVDKGNMIMSICATIGKPIYTDFKVCIHDGFVVFENPTVDKEYLYYFLQKIQKKWYEYGQPGTQVNLNSDIVSNEKIPYPCPAEQQKIASFLSAIDKKIEKTGQQIEASQQWKQGLLQKMFV